MAIRDILTSYVNSLFRHGVIVANIICAGTSRLDDHWAYSISFGFAGMCCAFDELECPLADIP